MKKQSLMEKTATLLQALGSGGVILAPNKRLSRFLNAQIASYKASLDQKAWVQYDCMAFTTLMKQYWDAMSIASSGAAAGKVPIDNHQATGIWKSIIDKDDDIDLFSSQATAQVAHTAWQQVILWRCEGPFEESTAEELKRWSKEYQQELEKKNLVDDAGATQLVLQAIEAGSVKLPKAIALFAFDDMPPQVQKFVHLVKEKGVKVIACDWNIEGTTLKREYFDKRSEIHAAAEWAESQIAQDGSQRIGIVVPNLSQYRSDIERAFNQVFEPQTILPKSQRHAPPFNISAATKLNDAFLVNTALKILKLAQNQFTNEDIEHLLHSPYLGKFEELHARSQLAKRLREKFTEYHFISLRQLSGELEKPARKQSERDAESTTQDFYERLQALSQIKLTLPKQAYASEWTEFFKEILLVMGWPGERALDTIEYQQLQLWLDTFEQYAHYDYSFNKIPMVEAINLFERLVQGTPFHVQTSDSPVQILGLYEAAGLVFDRLWVMHLDAQTWPQAIKPNALLPLALQKQFKMPLACAERETHLAKTLTERFLKSASHVIVSYSLFDGDKICSPSRLIDHVNADLEYAGANTLHPYYIQLAQDQSLEKYQNWHVTAPEKEHVKGGSSLLKDVAACPFKAFAKHRLGIKEHYDAQIGLNALQRGNLMHFSLESLWKKLKNQETLVAQTDAALEKVVADAISHALARLQKHDRISMRLAEIESARLKRLILSFLAIEKQRPAFTVTACEEKSDIELAGLRINFRIDRIDALSDNACIVIDYKTKASSLSSWFGERPDEPQVPLYAIANKEQCIGLAFAVINKDSAKFVGFTEEDESFSELKPFADAARYQSPDNVTALLEYWESNLTHLVSNFLSGNALADPKKGALTCQYCQFQSLCRIQSVEFGNSHSSTPLIVGDA